MAAWWGHVSFGRSDRLAHMLDEILTRKFRVLKAELRRKFFIALGDSIGYRRVFVPDSLALAYNSVNRAHDTPQVHPMQAGVLDNERVAGRSVNGEVECH